MGKNKDTILEFLSKRIFKTISSAKNKLRYLIFYLNYIGNYRSEFIVGG